MMIIKNQEKEYRKTDEITILLPSRGSFTALRFVQDDRAIMRGRE